MGTHQKLLTQAVLKKLPPLYSTEETPRDEKKVIVKFFGGPFTFYAIEFDPEKGIFFGWTEIAGNDPELGYQSLEELQSVRVPPFRLPLERDQWFKIGTRLGDVIAKKAS